MANFDEILISSDETDEDTNSVDYQILGSFRAEGKKALSELKNKKNEKEIDQLVEKINKYEDMDPATITPKEFLEYQSNMMRFEECKIKQENYSFQLKTLQELNSVEKNLSSEYIEDEMQKSMKSLNINFNTCSPINVTISEDIVEMNNLNKAFEALNLNTSNKKELIEKSEDNEAELENFVNELMDIYLGKIRINCHEVERKAENSIELPPPNLTIDKELLTDDEEISEEESSEASSTDSDSVGDSLADFDEMFETLDELGHVFDMCKDEPIVLKSTQGKIKYPGGMICRQPLRRDIYVLPIYLKLAGYANSTRKGIQLEEFNRRFLKRSGKSLPDFIERHMHANFFAWASDTLLSEETKLRDVFLKAETALFHGKKAHSFIVPKDYWEKYDIKNVRIIRVELASNTEISFLGEIVKSDQATRKIIAILFKKGLDIERLYNVISPCIPFTFLSKHRTLMLLYKKWKTNKQTQLLFPIAPLNSLTKQQVAMQTSEKIKELKTITSNSLNNQQKAAVVGILEDNHLDIPYILFGPPGTGKTTTLVEAVAQILHKDPLSRVLVCTPSNTAADVFALSLLKQQVVTYSALFRMYSLSKRVQEQNPLLKLCTVTINDPLQGFRKFAFPKRRKFNKFRVVICTLSCSTYLVNGKLKGRFSHVIVDEAGQADEVETLIPIVGLGNEKTRFVMAGDPRQLGPVVASRFLETHAFGTSLLERLIQKECYTDDRFYCMLKHNYRSHSSLVDFVSNAFYRGELISSATDRSALSNWNILPKKGFPLFWHSVNGKEELETDGFSYSNVEECHVVINYVEKILKDTSVKPLDIGIICPYKKQAKVLRELLVFRYSAITVESVERFQGSERRVILISTVRTEALGFLSSFKRLNTSVTRAQELLIIVGKENNLKKDPHWKKLIDYCKQNNALLETEQKPILKSEEKEKLEKQRKIDPKFLLEAHNWPSL